MTLEQKQRLAELHVTFYDLTIPMPDEEIEEMLALEALEEEEYEQA